jgi:HK97 family phage prohead protease
MELTRKLLDTASVTLADQRLVTVICSTGEPDRMGDVIVQNGIDLTAYRKNPVVLWGHSADVPIAKAIEIDVKNGKLQATVQFPPEGDDEDADWVYGKIKAGIVNATSVGFIPKDYEPLDPKQPWGGFKFVKSELLEFSFVSIPANSGCLIVGRSLLNAVDVPMLPSRAKSSGIKDADLPNEVKIPRNVLEEVFRLAKTPRTMRQKYLARAADPSWKVGAADDLSVIDAEAWDGAAAAKRILDDAGFDGDSPDVAKAARGFLLHDAANPVLRSSYKLPFADIVDGELKAIKSGVAAAKGRLDQTSVPLDVLDQAKEIADDYDQKEFEITAPVEKSGRKISNANAALLQKAMDHHASATQCIKDVLGGDMADDPDGDEGKDPDGDAGPEVVVLSAREQRLAEAKALRESAKL